jgi:hypothetical protein
VCELSQRLQAADEVTKTLQYRVAEDPFSIFMIIIAEQETEGQTGRNEQGHTAETFSCECTKHKFNAICRNDV